MADGSLIPRVYCIRRSMRSPKEGEKESPLLGGTKNGGARVPFADGYSIRPTIFFPLRLNWPLPPCMICPL